MSAATRGFVSQCCVTFRMDSCCKPDAWLWLGWLSNPTISLVALEVMVSLEWMVWPGSLPKLVAVQSESNMALSVTLVLPLSGLEFTLAVTRAWEVVMSPTLVADYAISSRVCSYPGQGALDMTTLVAIGTQLIVVSSLAVFDLILFGSTVLATCCIYTLAL